MLPHNVHGPATVPLPVPQTKSERDDLWRSVEDYVAREQLVPPLSLDELLEHADSVLAATGTSAEFREFAAVLVGNAAWHDTVAGVPFDRRILLLPQCLRTKAECPAELDEYGLLCEQCGRCPLGDLQEKAERLGYIVLIAEGTTVVTQLLQDGRVDAVIGVGCMSSLERSFPYMAADAIPGIAIPLTRDGCDHTEVDLDWLDRAIALRSEQAYSGRFDLDQLRSTVMGWFVSEPLRALLAADDTQTEDIGISWLAKSGKRWRPILAVSVYGALNGHAETYPETLRRIAVAVECFHKASLVHDDIEDDDDTRYGEQTLHRQYGIPIALNVGDFLLGEGYRLIASSGTSPEQIKRMLAVAADGHRTLCLGQGKELAWVSDPTPLSSSEVIDIFLRKTAPAFEVALRLGAITGGSDGHLCEVLRQFSQALGVAYQIRDDILDFMGNGDGSDADAMRPSLLLALAYENASRGEQQQLRSAWRDGCRPAGLAAPVRALLNSLDVEPQAHELLSHYRKQAIATLRPLRNVRLKSLLHRLTGRILRDV